MVIAQPTYWQYLIVDEKQNRKIIIRRKLTALTNNNLYQESNLIDTSKDQQGHKVRVGERSYTSFEILGMVRKVQEKILSLYKK